MPHITRKRLALAKDVFRPSSIAGRAVLVSSVLASYLLSDVRILLKGSSHNNFMTGAMAAPGEKETPNKSAIRAFTSLHEFLKTGDVTKLDDFETVWQQYPSSSQKFEDFKKFFFEVIKEDPIIMLVIRTYNEYKKPKELDLDEVLKEVCQIHEQLNLKDLDYNGLKRKYPGQEATRFLETILEARLGSEFLLDLKKGATPTVLLEGLLADSKKSFTELEKQTDSYLLGMDKTSKDALKSRLEEEHFASLRQRLEELEKNPKLDKAIAFDTDVKTLQQEIRISAYIAYQFSLYLYTGDNSFFDRNASSLGGGISTGGVPFDVNVRMGFLSAKDKDYDWRESQNRLPVDSLFSLYLQSYTKWMLPGFESVTAKKASTLGDAATFGQNLRPVMETANSVLRLDRSKYADAWHNLEYQYKEVTGDSRDIILRARIYDENTWSEIAYNSWGVVKDKRTSLGEMPLNFENWLELSESTHQMQAWKDTVNSVLDQYGRVKKESGVWKYKSSAEQAAALQKKSPKDAAKEAITISSRELQERSVIESLRLKMTVVDAYFFDEAVRKLQSISMLSDPAITSLVETLASIYDRDPYLASSFLHNVVPVAAESYDQDGFVAILANFRASVENVLASDLPRHERRKFLLDVFKDLEGIPEQIAVYNKKNMESELRQYPKDSFEYVNAFAMRASQLLGRDAFFQELLPIMPALGLFQTLPQGPTDVGGAAFAITFLSSAEVIHSEVRANLEGKLIPKFEQMIPAQARLKRWDYQAFITAMRAKFNNMPVEYADFSDWLSAGAGMAGYANSAGKIDAIEEGFFQTATGGGSFHGQETITQNPDSKLINIQESLAGVDTVAGPLHTQDGYINWSETKGVGTVEDDAARAYAQIARNTGHNILFMQEGYYRNLESTNSSATSIKGGELQVETGSTWRRKGRIGYSDKYGQTILIATSQAKDNNYVTYTPFDVATGKPSSSSYDVIKETDSALGERAFYTTKDGKKHLLPSDLQQTAVTALSGTMGQLWQVINNYTYARLGLEPGATMPANQGVEADIKSMPFWKNPALSRGTSLNGFSMGYDLGDW
ncbi:MAG: hypothetical protein Q7S22_06715, partial [Candidatus Micrarchaeota archaeon]|nr:hypothetical protein [Candidatus Micrarchaeota archaeon]